jgi:chemotaxis protein CheX
MMDVKYINPFLEATEEVLKTMAFLTPSPGKPYIHQKGEPAYGDVTGIIGLSGQARGSLALSFKESCIFVIISGMLGETYKEINNEVADAVGELTNMISGVARQKLEAKGLRVTAAIPTVIVGKNHSIQHILSGPSVIIPFHIGENTFVIDVCVATEGS